MLFQWFSDNQMKANISKCHPLMNKKDEITIRIRDTEIKNSEYDKLKKKTKKKTTKLS